MEKITSAQNVKVKRVKELLSSAKSRKKAGLFAVEGRRICREIPPELIREMWFSESFVSENESSEISGNPPTYVVPDTLFASMSDTVNPQGVLALVKKPENEPEKILAGQERKLLLFLEGVQDPGNMGTIFRTAEAAGVDAIVMDKGCADVFSPKVVRSTMGAIFRVKFVICDRMPEMVCRANAAGFKTFAAALDAERDFRKADYSGKSAILIGNEGNGLSKEVLDAVTDRVIIPMCGNTESLNASVAAALLMYEANRANI